jgi:citrate synthase
MHDREREARMRIGPGGPLETSIATADAASVEVRGRDLCGDLMGRVSFTEYFFLLVTGREPTADQRFFLDVVLVAIAEHGLMPSVQAARMTLAAAPEALQGAVAAGLLGAGGVILGTSELCARLLAEVRSAVEAGADPDAACEAAVSRIRADGGRLPGFGHPLHKPVDPRAERILSLADARGVAGVHVDLARRIADAAERAYGRRMVMNVSMPIAAVLLDIDVPLAAVKGVPLLARTASLVAHLAEEAERPIGFGLAAAGEDAATYVRRDPEDR